MKFMGCCCGIAPFHFIKYFKNFNAKDGIFVRSKIGSYHKKGAFMNYSPKHNDTPMRVIYGALITVGLIMYMLGGGNLELVFTSVALVLIGTGLYLFIKHDLTTFTYIVMENEGRLDFYVDRVVGKRGSYVCYYPLCDLVIIEKYEKGTRKRLNKEYGKTFVYKYFHNRFNKEKYVLVFKNQGYHDAVVCQLDTKAFEYLKSASEAEKNKYEE